MKKINKSAKRNLLLSVDKVRPLQPEQLGRVIGGMACGPSGETHVNCDNALTTP